MNLINSFENFPNELIYNILLMVERKDIKLLEGSNQKLKKKINLIKNMIFEKNFKFFDVGMNTSDPYGSTLKDYLKTAELFDCKTKLKMGEGSDSLILFIILHNSNHVSDLDLSLCTNIKHNIITSLTEKRVELTLPAGYSKNTPSKEEFVYKPVQNKELKQKIIKFKNKLF